MEILEPKEKLVPKETQANPAVSDHLAMMVLQESLAQMVCLETRVMQAHKETKGLQGVPVALEIKEKRDQGVILVSKELLVNLARMEVLEMMD